MIIFFKSGRLGNQIFQYVFLKSVAKKNEKIILVGLNDIFEVFQDIEAINIRIGNKYARYFISKFIKPVFDFLANKRILSSYRQIFDNMQGYLYPLDSYRYNSGFIKNIRYVCTGHFQSENFFDRELALGIKIKKNHVDMAYKLLSCIPEDSYKIFIHVRRGDYLNWSVFGENPTLPASYFHKQINWFNNNRKNCFFLFLSDDPKFIENEFSYIKNKAFSANNHVGADLAIMSMCDGAVLSNSSLSWWGAYLMRNRDIVFAPKYWLGFKTEIWYPYNINQNFFKIVEIK